MSDIIGGVNPVLEALKKRAGNFQKLYLAKGRSGPAVEEVLEIARAGGVSVQWVDRTRLDRLYGRSGHQGVVAQVGPYRYHELEDILESVSGPTGLVLLLDGIQDPVNLGSLMRSADAAGAAGIVMPKDRSAPVTAAAVKTSAGAAEHVRVARVVNLARAIEEMKEKGFWILGLDAEAGSGIYDMDLNMKLGLVVGAEGKGLGRLVRERCDGLVSLPLRGRISSLNAAVAGALAMFEFVRQTRTVRDIP